MAGFYGGDTEQMRQHGTACQQGSRRIADIAASTTALIDSVTWLGPDALAFRALWHGTVKPQMLAGAEEIRATGHEIDQHAEQQDQASNGGSGGSLGPLGPLGPMWPLTPDVIDRLREGLSDWATGGGATGPQEFYGTDGFSSRGQAADGGRGVGSLFDIGGDLLEGRELESDQGYLDVTAQGHWSGGAQTTTDPYGNVTGTVGLRGGMELGLDGRLDGPAGTGLQSSNQIGIEAYAEGGGTVGPDGFALGGRAGSGAYYESQATLDGGDYGSVSYGQRGFIGADASANIWSHATRNEDGAVNGWTVGADARAFAGGEIKHTFAAEAPGGWAFVDGSVSGLGGGGVGGGYGATLSTDEVSLTLNGEVAKGLGLGGSGTIGINPNAIVDSFTPGDYNLDDVISDVGGALETAGDFLSDINPF